MRFELTAIRELPQIKNQRITHWVAAGMTILFTLLAGVAFIESYSAHSGFTGWTGGDFAGIGIFAFFVAAGALFFITTGPGLDAIEVDDQSLIFIYANGRTDRLPWADPRFSLKIDRTEGTERRGRQIPAMIIAMRLFPAQNYLTREAFEGILQKAATRGLEVLESPSTSPGFTTTIIDWA